MSARMASPFVISDELWSKIESLLPVHKNTHRFGGGKPRKPDRVCMNAIFFVLRTGCQWKALNATGICPGSTAHDRFQEWVEARVFLRLWETGLEEYDELKGLNWSWLSMDGAMTKAPLGGEKYRPQSNRSRQRWSQAIVAFGGRRSSRRLGRRRSQPA
jgi:putative transposase